MTVTATETAARAAALLSRPAVINGLTVPNRIAMAPMTRMFSRAVFPARTWCRTTPGGPPPVWG